MNARERAVAALDAAADGDYERYYGESALKDLERADFEVVDRAELSALRDASRTLDHLNEVTAMPGARFFRRADCTLVVVAEHGSSLESLERSVPEGSVELVPAWTQCEGTCSHCGAMDDEPCADGCPCGKVDEKSRGPAYQRGRADGRLEQRAGDGAVPAAAGEQAPGPSGGGLVGPPAPEGDHVTRAQPFTDAELADDHHRGFGWFS